LWKPDKYTPLASLFLFVRSLSPPSSHTIILLFFHGRFTASSFPCFTVVSLFFFEARVYGTSFFPWGVGFILIFVPLPSFSLFLGLSFFAPLRRVFHSWLGQLLSRSGFPTALAHLISTFLFSPPFSLFVFSWSGRTLS